MPSRISSLGALLLSVALTQVTGPVGAATPPIAGEAVLAHIQYLAADELKGRGNGSEGLERAAEYIARQFTIAGLRPAGDGSGWFQPFEIDTGLAVGEGNALEIATTGRSVRFSLGSSYYPLAALPIDSVDRSSVDLKDVPLAFAGYGINAPAFGYNDYADIDVSGKAVLIFSHEPQENRRDSKLNGNRPLGETTLYEKALAARNRGALALLIVSDPSHQTDQANYQLFAADPDAEDHGIPVLRVRRTDLQPLLETWDLDREAAAIDEDLTPRSKILAGATARYTEFLARTRRPVRNIVGILPGADIARRDEALVFGAHYDHVGLGGRFSMSPERAGEIHNGADDNASGVASIIEIARAAAADPSRFPRSLVFVAFAGEERGLLGSAYYVGHPAVPMVRTIAMLNLDMVGRSGGMVNVAGLDKAGSFEAAMRNAARAAGGIRLGREGPGSGRSDDASFLDRRVPAIHFFTGFHDDYHRPGDDWDRIDAAGTARVATLALEFAARIAEQPDRPNFVE